MHFNNTFHQRQADARSVHFWIQFIEQFKNLVVIFRVYPDPVIAYIKDSLAPPLILLQFQFRGWVGSP